MVKRSGRTFKYGDMPIRAKTVQVVQEQFGGAATAVEVDEYLKSIYPNYRDDTRLNLIVNTVNCNRSYWSFNKTARRTDDESHRHHTYDRLFKRGNIFEIYNPLVHGVWELYENSQGKWCFREVKSEFEEAVDAASRLSSGQRSEILATKSKNPDFIEVTSRVFKRNPYVVAEVIFRANGKCQCCKRDAPFKREDGTPYLEVHHIEWLSRGGEDSVENAIALCPNCHRQAHYGVLKLSAINSCH
ncbi:Predicted restriction endonuclease [Serratia rubidaea]|uniref:Predicted restriction endonuclease n=1 Tax=Serratia rubidaea TaxID=61652 RepID=A0A4U9HHT9_SERRU|nr:HNH endonuclease [Serratia rubidaea]QPR63104.1 HNH endonuclease [Serratia rubidaea]CAI0766776.1 Predicted restriction endonuclease [Serratia rubidaea]CAI1573186.1 Predicted restriction endonuclease [Serratia rubidaea]VTP63640.1 Predicted restriction endonuclease [Serratia rubidaea]HAY0635095.1 HNH endonuclease [Serratia rubidaea]